MKSSQEKPSLERIPHSFGSSIVVKQYDESNHNIDPFWHFHPEMEIVYIKGGSGKRHIGNHMSFFQDGDLIFLGSNLPHYGFTDKLTKNQKETVVQVKEDFLGEKFIALPEMAKIEGLFTKAKKGLVFHNEDRDRIGAKVESLISLSGFERLAAFLEVLNDMSKATDYTILNVEGYSFEILPQDSDRMNLIYKYLTVNFKRPITLDQISDEVSMTVPAFCRYFKKMSNKTFTEFANEYRLVHASKLLIETSKSISEVCNESGFNNFSHFNKIFKRHHGMSPRDYRNSSKRLIVTD